MKTQGMVKAIVIAIFVLVLNSWISPGSTIMAKPADAGFHGIVTDTAGKPIRGAAVKVTLGTRAISRFTDQDGRYQITGLQTGNYRVSVFAYGFEAKSQTQDATQVGETNFLLKPHWSASQVSSAEMMTALPDNQETRFLHASCSGCHNLTPPFERRGLTADDWNGVIHEMAAKSTMEIGLTPPLDKAGFAYTAGILNKYVGADAPELTQDQVKHVAPSDAVLQATFYEFDVPTPRSFPHSIASDNHGNGWFGEYALAANKIAKLNFETGEITEYLIPLANAAPHTPMIDKDGKIWMPLSVAKRISYLDPSTGQITVIAAPAPGAHTGVIDREGNIWGSGGDGVFEFNKVTQKFQDFPGPVPKEIPQESQVVLAKVPGESGHQGGDDPARANRRGASGGSYDVVVDSKHRVWYTQLAFGTLVRLDPESGKTTTFKFPGIPSSRGLTVDANDNIWYSDWDGHKLVKFDQKTEKAKLYQPPTQYAAPYGMVPDKNGNIWYADYNGNNITRFDPKTEQFTEYPIPTRAAMPRFISVDNDGKVWFCEWWQSKVGVLIPAGSRNIASLK
jgi:virginiamycin B lyase